MYHSQSYSDMFEGKKILITGGTGSLGQALTKRLLQYKVDTIRIFSRNENKQVVMNSQLHDDRLRFLIGDVRDLPRLSRALEDIDVVFHAAALKHVPVIEYNPFEGIQTNVMGSQNVIDACLRENVDLAIAVGTDKAVSPLNTYGATKLLMEKLFINANLYSNPKRHRTKFVALRYGNVLGSSGSVVPMFIQQIKEKKKITITDPQMTRFSITMDEALDFILSAAHMAKGSEIFLPKLRAYSIMDLKDALFHLLGSTGTKIVGIRQGEKLHETLINNDEMRFSWELKDKYITSNQFYDEIKIKKTYPGIRKIKNIERYSSDVVEKISTKELETIIKKSCLL